MKKQILSFICGAAVALSLTMVPAVADSISKSIDVLVDYVTVTLDGEEIEVANFVHEGRTYLGLRDMGNALGLQVDWDEKTQTAILTSPGKTPVFPSDDSMQTIDIPIVRPSSITINGNVIDSEWITNRYNLYKSNYPTVADDLIKEAVVDDAAFQTFTKEICEKYNIEVNNEDYTKEAEESYIEFADSYGGIETLQMMLASSNIDPESHKAEYIASYIDNIVSTKVTEAIMENDADIKAFVDEKKALFEGDPALNKKTVATVKHILIPAGDTAQADATEVLNRLKKGEKFDKLLEEFNNDPGQPEEGYTVSINSGFVPEFEEASVKLKKDEFSDLVETSYGYHIIYCLDTKDEDVIFDDYLNQTFGEELYTALNAFYQAWYDATVKEINWGF